MTTLQQKYNLFFSHLASGVAYACHGTEVLGQEHQYLLVVEDLVWVTLCALLLQYRSVYVL